jgi:hypothetical protein
MQKAKAVVAIGCVSVLMAVLMSGCATSDYISTIGRDSSADILTWPAEVESIADTDADLKDKTYFITSAMQNISDEDLEFKEVAKWINNALKLKGYMQVNSKENASLLIRLAYGQGEPQITTSTYTSGLGYSYPVGYYRYYVPPTTETVTSTLFTAHLLLEAYDLTTSGKLPQVWKTTLTASNLVSGSSNSDPRISFLEMIAASINYFGTNTEHKKVKVYISNDPAGLALIDSLKK